MPDLDNLLAEFTTELRLQRSRRLTDPVAYHNFVSELLAEAMKNPGRYRGSMLKAAALALAAVAAHDERHPRERAAGVAVKMGP